MTVVSEKTVLTFQQCLGLFLARFCPAAWVGAASLFVVVGVMEVTRGGFDASTKDTLVAIRFPAFYVFGFTLIVGAWIGTWIVGATPALTFVRRLLAISALTIELVLMAADYFWIYLPLLRMVTPPGQTKPIDFVVFHEASKWINLAGLLFCLLATLFTNWPGRIHDRA